MVIGAWILGAMVVLALAGWLCHGLLENPRGDFETGVLFKLGRLYVRAVHRLEVTGIEHLPEHGPYVIVANHTAGVDPILVQSTIPVQIRWMMAQDMRVNCLEWFWRWQRVIFVDRDGRRNNSLRESLRHLRGGGVLGIFPEGGLERPPGKIMPFQRGVGMLLQRSGVKVVPIVIEGTPQVDPAWSSLWRTSRSRLRIMPPIDYTGHATDHIADDLRARYLEWTGWPANDEPAAYASRPGKGALAEPVPAT